MKRLLSLLISLICVSLSFAQTNSERLVSKLSPDNQKLYSTMCSEYPNFKEVFSLSPFHFTDSDSVFIYHSRGADYVASPSEYFGVFTGVYKLYCFTWYNLDECFYDSEVSSIKIISNVVHSMTCQLIMQTKYNQDYKSWNNY